MSTLQVRKSKHKNDSFATFKLQLGSRESHEATRVHHGMDLYLGLLDLAQLNSYASK